MSRLNSIVLVSGGMDSLVTAAVAVQESDAVNFLHITYGQRTQEAERRCFHKLVEFYEPADSMIVDISYLRQMGGSSLTDPALKIQQFGESRGIPNTYVPYRNGNFIAIATSWAEIIVANRIYIGAVEEDSSGYPDCRESFFQAAEETINQGTRDDTGIKIITPVIHMEKSEIVKLGERLQVPFESSWSCYKYNDVACGSCDSCVLRIRAFQKAGLKDPLPYRSKISWEACTDI
ncbi:MAG: 7-cyano-7-deazaguanine synthase QueC [Candidatus Cloacimonetes bacterium]|nr:7-cyano-7-deazaguanine synthase QueC [Candidatus Cloacimonadota bacterium]